MVNITANRKAYPLTCTLFNMLVKLWDYDWQGWMLTMRTASPRHFFTAASHSVIVTGADAPSCCTHTLIQVSRDEHSSLVLQRQVFVCSTTTQLLQPSIPECNIASSYNISSLQNSTFLTRFKHTLARINIWMPWVPSGISNGFFKRHFLICVVRIIWREGLDLLYNIKASCCIHVWYESMYFML